MNNIPMTPVGAQLLREELDHYIKVMRPQIINAISEARAHGDLKENAEYHAAKEQQSLIEGRIADLEAKLSNAQIIDISNIENLGKVIFGSTVTLINLNTDEQVKYQIVGDDEADIKARKISVSSPIARALIGKEKEKIVEVKAPAGLIEYEIINVEYS
ncbi:MAG: Transcription elongation factor GreA [Legionellaceae bacterium]